MKLRLVAATPTHRIVVVGLSGCFERPKPQPPAGAVGAAAQYSETVERFNGVASVTAEVNEPDAASQWEVDVVVTAKSAHDLLPLAAALPGVAAGASRVPAS